MQTLSEYRRYCLFLRKMAMRNYNANAAANYRKSDEAYKAIAGDEGKFGFIKSAAGTDDYGAVVLDLGCGTGRYFHYFNQSTFLIGLDVSRAMLKQAKKPVAGTGARVSLIESSLHEIEFKAAMFDVIYCMGVFGCVCAFDDFVATKVGQWLKPDGVFYFDVIERYLDPSPGTWRSRLAERIAPYLMGLPRAYVEARLERFTRSGTEVTETVMRHFGAISTSTHLGAGGRREDLLCVARKPLKNNSLTKS